LLQTVRKRYASLVQAQAQVQAQVQAPVTAPPQNAVIDDDEDYEPDYQPVEDAEQIRNRLEMESAADLGIGIPKPSHVSLGSFTLPAPRPLSREDLDRLAGSTMDSVLRRFDSFPQSTANKSQKSGFNRLAASSNDRQAMITTYIRLVTRPTAGLFSQSNSNGVHTEQKPRIEEMKQNAIVNMQVKGLHDRARQQILHYILNDWTRRMDIATTWLTEEWYNDKVCAEALKGGEDEQQASPNFPTWAHRFLDELSAFIGSEHTKLLVRFVSEVPGLDEGIIEKVKRLALDPERVTMVVSAIQ
jgi:symplekin